MTAALTLRLLAAAEAAENPTERARERGRRLLLAVVRRFVSSWQEAMWDDWRWLEPELLEPLVQSAFEMDLAAERERANWRRAVGLPEAQGRFVQSEWRRRIERLQSLDDAQKQRLAASLRGRYALEAERTSSIRVFNRTLKPPSAALETFRQEFAAAFEELMRAGAREGALQLGLGADWTLGHEAAVAHMRTYAGHYGDRLTRLVPMEWQGEIRKTVIAGLDEGKGAAEMARDIQGVWGNLRGYQAERIARTEAVRSHMEGRRTTYRQANVQTVIWVTYPAGCCDECASRNGKRYPVDSPLLPPQPHPNCRCDAPAAPEETERLRAMAFEGLE